MATEEVYVYAFDATYTQWVEIGNSPYLHDTDKDYIYTASNTYQEGDWTFPNSVGSGTINSVKLRFETRQSDEYERNSITVYVWDGSSWVNVGTIKPYYGTAYTWNELDVSAVLDTWEKINGVKVRLYNNRVAAGTNYVRRLTRKVDYTPELPPIEVELHPIEITYEVEVAVEVELPFVVEATYETELEIPLKLEWTIGLSYEVEIAVPKPPPSPLAGAIALWAWLAMMVELEKVEDYRLAGWLLLAESQKRKDRVL